MPLPLVPLIAGVAGAQVTRYFAAVGIGWSIVKFKELLADWYNTWVNSPSAKEWLTQTANYQIERAGFDPVFRNVTDKDVTKEDIDRLVAIQVNKKIGTTLTGVMVLTKDQIMQELGAVMAQRINSEAGTSISNIFPVARFRSEFGLALLDQIDAGTINAGAVITRERMAQLKGRIAETMTAYKPAKVLSTAYTEAQRASNRRRQAKYRRTHHQVWKPKPFTT